MSYPELTQQLIGQWIGEYMLKDDPSKPTLMSNSIMVVTFAVTGMFIKFEYAWEFEGEREEGVLLMGYDSVNKRNLYVLGRFVASNSWFHD